MDYTLMHKNIPVTDMVLDVTGFIAKLLKVHDEQHLPVGVKIHTSGADRKGLNDWWLGRSIPTSRDGLQGALIALGVSSSTLLIEKCLGLSLSDHYWVRPQNFDLKWDDINFFQNDFSEDVGRILFGEEPKNVLGTDARDIDFISPDNTSDGWLKKKWIISNGKRYLMKAGSGVFEQEPFNEVIATALMQRLGIPHIPYTLAWDNDKPYSLCENFVTTETELVPAWRIVQSSKRRNEDSWLVHLLRSCEGLGIDPLQTQSNLDKMLTLDYIIANEDRHYNNFGFLRNPDTLEWLGFAPIFDSGTSLWYNTQNVGSRVESKPFKKTHAEQIKLVQDFTWFDFDALDGFALECNEILAESPNISPERRAAISKAVMERGAMIAQTHLDLSTSSVLAKWLQESVQA